MTGGAAYLTAVAVIVSDRITKFIAVRQLADGLSIKVFPNIFHLTLVRNDGSAFGLFKGYHAFFITLSLLVMGYIAVYLNKIRKNDLHLSLSLGLVLGGTAGNFIDRVRFGHVIDFLDFRVWPVFNVADSAITVGVILLAWRIITMQK